MPKPKARSAFMNYVGAPVTDAAVEGDIDTDAGHASETGSPAASADVIYDVSADPPPTRPKAPPKRPRPSKVQKPMTVRTYADVQEQFDKGVDDLKRAKGQVIGALMNLYNRGEISGDTIKAEIRAMQYEREE